MQTCPRLSLLRLMSPWRCIPHTRPPAHCPMTSLSLLAQPHHPHHLLSAIPGRVNNSILFFFTIKARLKAPEGRHVNSKSPSTVWEWNNEVAGSRDDCKREIGHSGVWRHSVQVNYKVNSWDRMTSHPRVSYLPLTVIPSWKEWKRTKSSTMTSR